MEIRYYTRKWAVNDCYVYRGWVALDGKAVECTSQAYILRDDALEEAAHLAAGMKNALRALGIHAIMFKRHKHSPEVC